jgi:hypothetical protein
MSDQAELRFAKTHQLTVAVSTITLVGAITAVGHLLKHPAIWELFVLALCALAIATAGGIYVWSLYHHLGRTRLAIDPNDTAAYTRDRWISITMIIIVVFSGIITAYVLFRGG